MDDWKLCELVRRHRCLYDPKDRHYKDINIRDNIWLEISKAMNQPVADCKSRWKNVRDTFMRRKRNKKIPKGSTRPQKLRRWYLENSLIFLEQVENERATLKNTKRQENIDNCNSGEESTSQTGDVEIEELTDNENLAEEHPIIPNDTIEQQSKMGNETEQQSNKWQKLEKTHNVKKSKVNEISKKQEKNTQERQILLSKAFASKVEDEHPIDIFFKSIAMSVKKMSEERQITAKMQICQFVGQLELEELRSSSASGSTRREHISIPTSLSYASIPRHPSLFSTTQEYDISRSSSALSSHTSSVSTP